MNWKEKYLNKVTCGDCLEVMKELPDNSIDLICTDPPYQLCNPQMGFHRGKQGSVFTRTGKGGFMGKEWDVIPSLDIWKECLRVLKPGAFAFIMCAPRQDSLCLMISRLTEAGFYTGFTSIYWTYASGFPKASNISKIIDKQECRKQLIKKLNRKPTKEEFEKEWEGFREVIGYNKRNPKDKKIYGGDSKSVFTTNEMKALEQTKPVSSQAKSLDGSYGGFQPKPAVEIILVVMKLLSEKTYVDQAMKNKKGITHLDDGRIPYESEDWNKAKKKNDSFENANTKGGFSEEGVLKGNVDSKGRFPANLLVSDDVLDDGKRIQKAGNKETNWKAEFFGSGLNKDNRKWDNESDEGSFSRFFSLDKWFESKLKNLSPAVQKVFPFLIVPKASKGEKNEGLYGKEKERICRWNNAGEWKDLKTKDKNTHPTCKPIKLMTYLITIGSREKDIILDPFAGSCSTGVSCIGLNRQYIMCEKEKEYFEIGKARLDYAKSQLKLF